ncbi:hypothetical protein BC829DRAFT_423866 [Chytridium lagenaria]|nr:hypothetical protein BC829DRAFT_423866 [Chytridium lagenaria]
MPPVCVQESDVKVPESKNEELGMVLSSLTSRAVDVEWPTNYDDLYSHKTASLHPSLSNSRNQRGRGPFTFATSDEKRNERKERAWREKKNVAGAQAYKRQSPAANKGSGSRAPLRYDPKVDRNTRGQKPELVYKERRGFAASLSKQNMVNHPTS